MSDTEGVYEVTAENTAAALQAGLPAVASTPWIVAIVEGASHRLVADSLPEGEITVGARIDLEHLLPSAVGARLRVSPSLEGQDGRTYSFTVTVYDREAVVARATHVRTAVPRALIEHKAAKLLAAAGG